MSDSVIPSAVKNPIHLKAFNDSPLPEVIYFDTSFVFACLVKNIKYNAECLKFIERLAKVQPIIVMSQLVRSELFNAILNLKMRDRFKGRVFVDQEIRKDPTLIDQFYPDITRIDQDFVDLMQRFTYWSLEPVTQDIIDKSLTLIKTYRLKSNDAIHIASMVSLDIKDIAVFDWAIEDISDINVWTHEGLKRYKDRHKEWEKIGKRKIVNNG